MYLDIKLLDVKIIICRRRDATTEDDRLAPPAERRRMHESITEDARDRPLEKDARAPTG